MPPRKAAAGRIARPTSAVRSPCYPPNLVSYVRAALACAYALLWIGGTLSVLLSGRSPDWAPPISLFLAAVLIFIDRRQDRRWLVFVAATGFSIEALGVHFGFPFGRYEYSSVLQPQVLRVPLVLICAWVVMTAYARQAVSRRFASVAMRVAAGGAWMMALDLLIDPVATNAMSYWRWLEPGSYYGVPLSNFAGWFVAGALLISLAGRGRGVQGEAADLLGLSIVVYFGIVAAERDLILPALWAAVLCAIHVCSSAPRERPAPRQAEHQCRALEQSRTR
jgi:uncharacterized membrane protein